MLGLPITDSICLSITKGDNEVIVVSVFDFTTMNLAESGFCCLFLELACEGQVRQ